MWPALAFIFLVAALLIHFRWKRRFNEFQETHASEIRALQQQQSELTDKSLAQQEALLNSMAEGLLVLDADGRIQLTNRALQKLFGNSGNVHGKTVLEAFRLHSLSDLVERLKTDQQILDVELEIPGLKARCFQVNAAAVIDDEGERHGAVMIFHELTRLKELENTRQEFVANVSHELRTPLSMIKGYAETLLAGAKDDPEVSTRFLQTIERHADRLAFLIEDLLTISRLESGQMILNCQPTDVRELTANVFEDLRSRAEKQRVTLQNEIADQLSVHADGDRLRQVLWNLVENAIKYGREEGCIAVSASNVSDNQITISIKDNGAGIPPEALPRIFERFYRVDKARSREAGGTGLGLSIVKHIIQCHGGKVWAESELDQGSTFYFTLRLAGR